MESYREVLSWKLRIQLDIADFYTTDSYTSSFPDDNCGLDPAEKCNRPYKHTLQKELLARDDVVEVGLQDLEENLIRRTISHR